MLTLYHNPRCSKSRACLKLLQDASIPVNIVDYIREGLSLTLLKRFADTLSLEAILRKNEALYKELNLEGADNKTILEAIAAHPQLMQRPIAVLGEEMILARPPEKILELVNE
ncbi:ArsC/Spx/MgsR family protein [Legionella hackeliae]|uniref:Arsenate reductase n=1 Tax=Legionella hackeliae TaxID=449 RepID=A0A0A8UST3_LEGHA|nr:ArsC/Spx/MgsR family protein [Legionella hackeliae]KTD09895.1 arsenate reductase [Legionella hackeliae]CEK11803.1 Arsenate reductase [Legionella hackeliae]STX48573.1 arsenate reductase [Legionella hackeliae]